MNLDGSCSHSNNIVRPVVNMLLNMIQRRDSYPGCTNVSFVINMVTGTVEPMFYCCKLRGPVLGKQLFFVFYWKYEEVFQKGVHKRGSFLSEVPL